MTICAKETPRWLRRISLLVAFSISTASMVSAQTAQPAEPNLEAALARSTAVWLADAAGPEEKAALGLRQVTVRESDSLINGALIGAGAALGAGILWCHAMEPSDVCFSSDQVGPYMAFAAIGAGIGIGLDALIRKQTTIYETAGGARLTAAPIVGRRGAGLRMSFSF